MSKATKRAALDALRFAARRKVHQFCRLTAEAEAEASWRATGLVVPTREIERIAAEVAPTDSDSIVWRMQLAARKVDCEWVGADGTARRLTFDAEPLS